MPIKTELVEKCTVAGLAAEEFNRTSKRDKNYNNETTKTEFNLSQNIQLNHGNSDSDSSCADITKSIEIEARKNRLKLTVSMNSESSSNTCSVQETTTNFISSTDQLKESIKEEWIRNDEEDSKVNKSKVNYDNAYIDPRISIPHKPFINPDINNQDTTSPSSQSNASRIVKPDAINLKLKNSKKIIDESQSDVFSETKVVLPPNSLGNSPNSRSANHFTVVSKSPTKKVKKQLHKINHASNKNKKHVDTIDGKKVLKVQLKKKPYSIREIVMGRDLPPPTLNRHLSIDTSISSSLGNQSIHNEVVENSVCPKEVQRISIFGNDTKPGDIVLAPRPNDVLFPLSGMTQWPGNELFLMKIDSRRQDFLTCIKRSDQARIALEVIQDVVLGVGQNQPIARFLAKQQKSFVIPGTTCPWVVMDETLVLVQLGKSFRGETDSFKHNKHDRLNYSKTIVEKSSTKSNDDKNKITQSQASIENEEINEDYSHDDDDSEEDDDDPLAALKSLYHIPSYAYRETQPLVQRKASEKLQHYSNGKDIPQANSHHSMQHVESIPTKSLSSSKRPHSSIGLHGVGQVQKRQYKQRKSLPTSAATTSKSTAGLNSATNHNSIANTSKLTSKVAAFMNEGEVLLPKGVTVRPSGKWVSNIQWCLNECVLILRSLTKYCCLFNTAASSDLLCRSITICRGLSYQQTCSSCLSCCSITVKDTS